MHHYINNPVELLSLDVAAEISDNKKPSRVNLSSLIPENVLLLSESIY